MTDLAGGNVSATARSSVVENMQYGKGPSLTVGVEEEYMILDRESLALTSRIDDVLGAVAEEPWGSRVMPELTESCVEVATTVCRTLDEAHRDLAEIRGGLARVLEPLGLAFGSAGTHPFSRSDDQRITSKDRYRELVEQLQYVARREVVFGMHIHVAVPDPEVCLQVMEGVLIEVPVLLALSANSPFWQGRVSGLASTRTAVFSGFPRSGLPPRFASYDDYAESVLFMEETGVIRDYTHLWWDVRPHPKWGTLEIRVCDAQFDLEYSLALVAYVQSMVRELLEQIEGGNAPPSYHRMLLAENKWQALRYGLDAEMMDLESGQRQRVRAGELARRRMQRLEPHARELGCYDALQGINKILREGTGAARQMRVYNANHDLYEMLGELAEFSTRG
jgi:carboxylate-amine ligase